MNVHIPKEGPIRQAFNRGTDAVIDELLDVIATLEESRSDGSYGKGQKFILRRIMEEMFD